MDANSQLLAEAVKKKVYDDLADALIKALEDGQIVEEDARKSSEFVLQQLDTITTKESLLSFLETLANDWPIYKDVYAKILDEDAQEDVKKKIAQIQNINSIPN